MLVSQWAGISFGVLDTAMTGHASPTDLAAMALSASIYITIFVGLMGVVHALIPILAQHFGAGSNAEVGRSWGQGVWLALGLSVVGAILMLFPDVWLSMSGDVAPDVRNASPPICAPWCWRCPRRWCSAPSTRWAPRCRAPSW